MTEPSSSDRLEAIFREHYEAVLAYARRRAPAEVADDVAAETFAIAWRKAEQIPREPLPWLLGVARRVLSTHRRSTRRRSRLRDRLSQRSNRSHQSMWPISASAKPCASSPSATKRRCC